MKGLRLSILLLSSALSLFISIAATRYIAQRYFFDLLYYQKSHEFGYYFGTDYDNYSRIHDRIKGIDLVPFGKPQVQPKVTTNKHHYTIVVIGDSYVWGQGIKISDRFTDILRNKLNKIRKTDVYPLALPGDNFLDNLSKYDLVSRNNHVDLYIFILNYNDILINNVPRFFTPLQKSILSDCGVQGPLSYDTLKRDVTWNVYEAYVTRAWKNEPNLCTLSAGAPDLPHNALYAVVDNYTNTIDYSTYLNILEHNNLITATISQNSPGIEQYKKYWSNPDTYFKVSAREGHPSKLANQMYADYFYLTLMTDPRWKFYPEGSAGKQ